MRSSGAKLLSIFLLLATQVFAQYQIAKPGYSYQFPRDHFDHPAFRTEWWYYTGNLRSADGHRFGFELTFFREGVNRKKNSGDSPWNVRDLYIAHFALSDITGQHFYHTERVNRAGPGLAGVSESSGLIWNGNWRVRWSSNRQDLNAVSEQFSIELSSRTNKPPVVHGENGISQKGAGDGHASHYISFTRLLTTGSVRLQGREFSVEGTSWMDHEFFTNQLAADEPGWDWLSVQLSDNTELMLYRLRHKDGSIDPFSSTTYVDAQGKPTHLLSSDFTLRPSGSLWISSESRGRYPINWHIEIPKLRLKLDITTPLRSQEIVSQAKFTPSYWEGAIDISGSRESSPINGVGYLEMTGYAESVQF